MLRRSIIDQVRLDLEEKMVFLAGPRQVGKTTLAKTLLGELGGAYLNWDVALDRERILLNRLPLADFLVFDEIHKFKDWRDFLKGVYDLRGKNTKILVTGSARLDYYRYGGDSLQGRYHFLRMHPLTCGELGIGNANQFKSLLDFGAFPEIYIRQNLASTVRWSRQYRVRLVEDELRDLELVSDVRKVELLSLRLPQLVGSNLSINSLAEDLAVSHKTLSRWLDVLERLYFIFRIRPLQQNQLRALKKEQKHYHFDGTMIESLGAKLENLVACHLLKWVQFKQDVVGKDWELVYFRDLEGREVDFVITDAGVPIMAIEVKVSDKDSTKSLNYFKGKFPECDCLQLVMMDFDPFMTKKGVKVLPVWEFLVGI